MADKLQSIHDAVTSESVAADQPSRERALTLLNRFVESCADKKLNATVLQLIVYYSTQLLRYHNSSEQFKTELRKLVAAVKKFCFNRKIIWPELRVHPEQAFRDAYDEMESAIMSEHTAKRAAVKQIEQLAPRFYTKEDEREFNKKEEMKKLKEKRRKLKKKLVSEITSDTHLKLAARTQKEKKTHEEKSKQLNRLANELQQQKKIIEKENTSLAKVKRIKKKSTRKAGNKR